MLVGWDTAIFRRRFQILLFTLVGILYALVSEEREQQ